MIKLHGGETKANPPNDDQTTNDASPSEPHMNQTNDKAKFESSTSDMGSSVKNFVDPFALLELRDNFSAVVSKVESSNKSFTQLDSKLDAKVFGLNTKLDVILLSLSKVTKPGP